MGTQDEKKAYANKKIDEWVSKTRKMTEAAHSSPQAVHTAFTKSLQCQWAFLQRVVEGTGDVFKPLWHVISRELIPAIFGRDILGRNEVEVLALPARLGGIGMINPTIDRESSFQSSKRTAEKVILSISTGDPLDFLDHQESVATACKEERELRKKAQEERGRQLIETLGPRQQRILDRVKGASQWLSAVPTAADGQDLSADEFRDALALRYGLQPNNLPAHCDGCGATFDVNHALNCLKGGLVKRGHDSLRDTCSNLAELAWGGVSIEPVLREAEQTTPALIADIKVRGVWHRERPAFFDTRIINADAVSYQSQTWDATGQAAAQAKHAKYDRAAEDVRGSFTPLVTSCDGALHREFTTFLKRMAHVLSEKWTKPYSHVLGWIRLKIQIGLIRAINQRVRGTRRRIRCLGTEDGAAIGEE